MHRDHPVKCMNTSLFCFIISLWPVCNSQQCVMENSAVKFAQYRIDCHGRGLNFVPTNQLRSAYTSHISNTQNDTGRHLAVDLALNAITNIRPNDLPSSNRVHWLLLSKNRISTVALNSFTGFANLTFLSLDNNRLTVIYGDMFMGLSKLTVLQLQDNQIGALEENAFSGLSSLLYLDLSNNSLTSLHLNALEGAVVLEYMFLYVNNIQNLLERPFYLKKDVRIIDLSNNSLVTIPPGTFDGLTSLRTIDLRNNPLDCLTPNTGIPTVLVFGIEILHSCTDDYTRRPIPPTTRFGSSRPQTTIEATEEASTAFSLFSYIASVITILFLIGLIWYLIRRETPRLTTPSLTDESSPDCALRSNRGVQTGPLGTESAGSDRNAATQTSIMHHGKVSATPEVIWLRSMPKQSTPCTMRHKLRTPTELKVKKPSRTKQHTCSKAFTLKAVPFLY